MAAPHPHYTQPGPSSLPYQPPPPNFVVGHSPPYQLAHQHPPNPASPRNVNGAGRGSYPHQGPTRPGPVYPYYPPPPQQYQHGPYPLEHQLVRPHHMPYQQQHINGGPQIHMARASNSPNPPPHFIHPNAPRHPTFPPTFYPHAQQYPLLSPGPSPSALPKQLLMPRPPSPPQHPLPLKPAPHVQPDPPPPLSPPSQEKQQPSASPPSSPSQQPVSPALHPSPLARYQPPSQQHPTHDEEPPSPTPLSPSLSFTSQLEPPAPYVAFPERSNSKYSLSYRRPDVIAAVAVNVASAARPPQSFYDLTAHLDDDPEETPASPPTQVRPLSPEPAPAPAVSKPIAEPDSPPQQSLASSATTTTSTAPYTPTPGSPLSSITSVSLPAKSPSVLASPAASIGTIATDAPEVAPTPVPVPVKKSWASLLRPATTGVSSAGTPSSPNSLPTSSVQGFSIPATASTSATASGPPTALVALLTSPHAPIGPAPPLRARGLVNLGNMCFANTVLQVLVFCPSFYRFFVELARTPRGENVRPTPLIDATVAFIKEFQEVTPAAKAQAEEEDTGRDAFVPTCVYDGLKEKKRFDSMRGGQQEDAEEFLGFYLDTLEEELLSMIAGVVPPVIPAPVEERVEKETQGDGWLEVGKKNKSVVTRTHKSQESPISRMFGGRFRTALRVPGTRESVMVDPWSRLQLDIQPDYVHTIEDALRHGAAPGTVQVTRPGAQGDASQQTLIEALPPVLVLHLKRFLYDTTVGDVVKLRKRVAFSTELEVPKEALAPARRTRPHKYQLFGVLNHHGGSATGGHYTLDVLHPNAREGWLRIDDEVVQHVRAEDLPGRDVGDDRTAYLLFYQRIASPGSRM